MIVGLVTFFMFVLYFIVLFINGIELNEVTTVFSVLYFCCWVLILLLLKMKVEGKAVNYAKKMALVLVAMMIGVISYEAITELPESDHAFQKELAVILGNSPQLAELGQLSNHDIESVTFHGDPKYGSFHQFLDYIVEVKLTQNDRAYYFMCRGNGPYCSQYERVEEEFALKMIEDYR